MKKLIKSGLCICAFSLVFGPISLAAGSEGDKLNDSEKSIEVTEEKLNEVNKSAPTAAYRALRPRANTNYALNAVYGEWANLNVWRYDPTDPDQRFEIDYTYEDFALIRRSGSNFCFNTPSRFNGGNVFMWTCDASDQDQWWRHSVSADTKYIKIYLAAAPNFCLNTHDYWNYGNVNIWQCIANDYEQQFTK